MRISFSKKLRVGALVAGATLIGPLLSLRFPAIVYALGLPSRDVPFRVQHVSGLVTYPLVQSGLFAWLGNSVCIVSGSWLLATDLTERQQWALLLAGVIAGALAFEALYTDAYLIGAAPAAYAILGSVVVRGLAQWRRLTNRWRMIVIFSMAAVISLVFTPDPGGRCSLAATVVGAALTWWFLRGDLVRFEGDDFHA
jgi:Rhomboid family